MILPFFLEHQGNIDGAIAKAQVKVQLSCLRLLTIFETVDIIMPINLFSPPYHTCLLCCKQAHGVRNVNSWLKTLSLFHVSFNFSFSQGTAGDFLDKVTEKAKDMAAEHQLNKNHVE